MISIALIEDNHLVREGISALLNQADDLRVVAAVPSDGLHSLRNAEAEVILLDLGLRNADSLSVVETVRQDCPVARIIVMDILPIHEELSGFADAGVAGFILKDASVEDLLDTIRTVAAGGLVLSLLESGSLLSRVAIEAAARNPQEAIAAVRLTLREREVINLIAEGLNNTEIAARLEIKAYTVRSHVRNAMEKLALHTRLQIAAFVHRDTPHSGVTAASGGPGTVSSKDGHGR